MKSIVYHHTTSSCIKMTCSCICICISCETFFSEINTIKRSKKKKIWCTNFQTLQLFTFRTGKRTNLRYVRDWPIFSEIAQHIHVIIIVFDPKFAYHYTRLIWNMLIIFQYVHRHRKIWAVRTPPHIVQQTRYAQWCDETHL